ncbi:MAG: class I SAM-dependent methyltransferase [Gammaproteobacteria bacterium]
MHAVFAPVSKNGVNVITVGTKKINPTATMAEQADIHELYEEAVQNVETEVEFLLETYRDLRGRDAESFREDFCGTGSTSCEWVRSGSGRYAVGVDTDADVLDWGRQNRIEKLPEPDRPRVKLLNDDVMKVQTDPVDVVGAFNFSYWIFKSRSELREYFSRVRAVLKSDGVFFVDAYGGSEAYEEQKEKTKHEGFTYIWDQASFEPVTASMICHIHFKFKDGSRIKKAFSYDWRLWTLPEIREVMEEAGFSNTRVYWEDEDEEGEGTGEFHQDGAGEADPAWIAYIVGEK